MHSNDDCNLEKPYNQIFQSNSNVTTKVSNLSFAKSVLLSNHPVGTSGMRPLFFAVQKPVLLMIYLHSKFYLLENHFRFFMSTKSDTKTCLLASKHFKLFRCEADNSCFSEAMPSVLEVFAHQVFNVNIDTNEPKEVQEATRWYPQRKECVRVSWWKVMWRALRRLGVVQTFKNHISFMALQRFDDLNLFIHDMHLWWTL